MGIKLFVIAVSIGFLAITAQAQDKNSNRKLVAKLEQLRGESEHKTEILAGKPKQEWLLREATINRLIGQLKAGQSVDPKAIDELLKENYR
jgi:hypothetical protein